MISITSAKRFVKLVANEDIDIIEHTHKVLESVKNINDKYFYFNILSEHLALDEAKKISEKLKAAKRHDTQSSTHANAHPKLLGLPISVKDCICVKDIESRAGSKILEGYKPVFDATAISKIKNSGGLIIGKTSQDEFGFGSFNTNVGVGFKIPKNPHDTMRACGGSSGGSAGITSKINFPHISLAESTGGSIASPAAFCGVAGLTPTYGRVSRYGLMDYANSLDKIGTIGKTVEDAAYLLEVISGFDMNESTTADVATEAYSDYVNTDVKGMKVGVINEFFSDGFSNGRTFDGTTNPSSGIQSMDRLESVQGIDQTIIKKCLDATKHLESLGVDVKNVSLPKTAKYGISAYYIIAMSEASTNLAKYCGMRYGASEKVEGNFNKYFSCVRSKNFGLEAKRRIMLGTFARMAGYRDKYYGKSLAVRKVIINEYKSLFKKFDALICPTMPFIAPRFDEIKKLTPLQNYYTDILTVGPNLAGMPHLSVNIGTDTHTKMPIGLMLTSDHFMEKNIIALGSKIEKPIDSKSNE